MHFYVIALRNLLRRKMRTFFTLLGIGSAVGAFIALVGLSRGFENAWSNALLERDTHIFATPRGVVDILSAAVDEKVGEKMAKVEGVVNVSGELVDMVDLDSGDLIIVAGWPLHSYLWESVQLERGAILTETDCHGAILGKELAETLHYSIGDTFYLKSEQFTVKGISKQGGVMRNNAMLLSLKALQEINNKPGMVTTLNFRVKDFNNRRHLDKLIKELEDKFPNFVFTEALDLAKNNRILRLFRAMAWGTSIIALFIGLVVILNTLLMSVMERTRELGLLSAVGWSGRRIISLIAIEGILLAAFGSVLGILIGTAGLYGVALSPQMKGLIHPAINAQLLLEALLATFFLGIAGSIYPAIRALHLSPANALRHE